MENANQALFMAAGVLVAVLIISLGIFLVSSVSNVNKSYDEKMSQTAIQNFNAQFTKFSTNDVNNKPDGVSDDDWEYMKYTHLNIASDVVSAVNLAYSLNADYDYDVQSGIQVVIKGLPISIWGSSSNYGITPLVQKEFHSIAISNRKVYAEDKGKIYPLFKSKKSEYENISINSISLKNTNELLEKFQNCKIYKGKNNYYRVYEYYFKGQVHISEETNLVDEIIFTLQKNGEYDDLQEN